MITKVNFTIALYQLLNLHPIYPEGIWVRMIFTFNFNVFIFVCVFIESSNRLSLERKCSSEASVVIDTVRRETVVDLMSFSIRFCLIIEFILETTLKEVR